MSEVQARLEAAIEGLNEAGRIEIAFNESKGDSATLLAPHEWAGALIGADRDLFDAAELGLAIEALLRAVPPGASLFLSGIDDAEGLGWSAIVKTEKEAIRLPSGPHLAGSIKEAVSMMVEELR